MMQTATLDKATILTVANVGATRRMTPEGFLLCENVAIGRIGEQTYTKHDLPMLSADVSGIIKVQRPAETVFSAQAIASFEGKPVTINHPQAFVTPHTWNSVTVGTAQNVRRGTGTQDDLLLADLLITTTDAIVYVNEALPDISCGYNADYEQEEPGKAIQRNVIGNHVALLRNVPGRAGSRCAVKDEDTTVSTWQKFIDKFTAAAVTKDRAAIMTAMKDMPEEEGSNAALAALSARMDTQDAALAGIADALKILAATAKTVDAKIEVVSTADASTLFPVEQLADITARIEILAPGTNVPTGDAATVPKMEGAMHVALMVAAVANAEQVKPFLGKKAITAFTGDALTGVVTGVSELIKIVNDNKQSKAGDKGAAGIIGFKGGTATIDSMNDANKAFWDSRTTAYG